VQYANTYLLYYGVNLVFLYLVKIDIKIQFLGELSLHYSLGEGLGSSPLLHIPLALGAGGQGGLPAHTQLKYKLKQVKKFNISTMLRM
jgi:hypothetical protein